MLLTDPFLYDPLPALSGQLHMLTRAALQENLSGLIQRPKTDPILHVKRLLLHSEHFRFLVLLRIGDAPAAEPGALLRYHRLVLLKKDQNERIERLDIVDVRLILRVWQFIVQIRKEGVHVEVGRVPSMVTKVLGLDEVILSPYGVDSRAGCGACRPTEKVGWLASREVGHTHVL